MAGMGGENHEMSDNDRGYVVGSKTIYEEEYLQCIRCGLCSYSCPSYRARLTQANSPRGRVALLRAAIQGELEIGKDFADRFYGCTLCAACDQVCPSGVEVEQILIAAREELAQRDLLSPSLDQLSRTVRLLQGK